jgi:GH15 family glucan-1,4-alpha-glucosidase
LAGRIEDYAIVGDMQSVALIGTDGSVDWLCLPRFDFDPRYGRLVGNMPQAFSHVPLVQTALNLSGHADEHRRGGPRDERRSVPG